MRHSNIPGVEGKVGGLRGPVTISSLGVKTKRLQAQDLTARGSCVRVGFSSTSSKVPTKPGGIKCYLGW